jgi:hypothetical protein
MIVTILLVFAFVFFVLSCFFPTQPPGGSRYNLLSIGLAAWVLSEIFQRSGLLGR